MGCLDDDTRLEGAAGHYRASLSRDLGDLGPNGGYLAVIALRAAGAEARVRRPVSFAAHYLSVARFAPVDLEVAALHRGRRSESFRVSMRQEGRPVLEAIVRTAAEIPGLVHDEARAPDVPGPDGLANSRELYGPEPSYPFWLNFESRPVEPATWSKGRPARAPLVREWYRFVPVARFEDPFLDAGRALLLIDTVVWPASCQRHVEPGVIAPSLDVVAWFHRPAGDADWLLADAESPIAESGLIGGTVRIWGADRRLHATGGAQLLCVPAT